MEQCGRDVHESAVTVSGGKTGVTGIERKMSIKITGSPALRFAQLPAAPELFTRR
jgi:hypothetical protein